MAIFLTFDGKPCGWYDVTIHYICTTQDILNILISCIVLTWNYVHLSNIITPLYPLSPSVIGEFIFLQLSF